MALVRWKQISPQLGDDGILSGSLDISGSLRLNGALFTGGGGSVQTLSLNGYDLSISGGNTVTLPSSGGSTDTGSLINSASAVGNVITFTKGDGSTFDITIDTGSEGASSWNSLSDIPAGLISSSMTASTFGQAARLNLQGTDIQFAGNGNSLTATSDTAGTGEARIRFTLNNVISSSAQIETLGFVTSSDAADLSALNTFTSSADSRLDALEAATSSYITTDNTGSDAQTLSISGDQLTISSGNTVTIPTGSGGSVPAGTISSSAQIAGLGYLTSASAAAAGFGSGGGSSDVTYNGDRIVSNEDLGDLFTNSFNAGTTGSIQEFLNAVFFPNTAPTFTNSSNFTINEFVANGSSVGTLTATDPENQTLTFATASAYTDNFVSVSSSGAITLNRVPTTEDFNTDNRGDGTLAHPVQVKVTDTFNTTTTDTIYINVTANSAPVFRQTSAIGNIITSFTINRNENDTADSNIGRIYFTDANSDTITIRSQSDATGHFSITKYSNYVQIAQVTSSLDYENITSYTLSITGSDEHYEASDDTDAITTLPITINVTDNQAPVANNQTFLSISEASSAGTTAGTVTASDNEGDTLTFTNFTLYNLELDGSTVNTGSYGGTSQSDPHEDAFQMNSSGVVTRKTGVYINSDIINNYWYRVQVKDAYNTLSDPAVITIPISDDPAPSIGGVNAFYIIESAVNGDSIYDSSNGYSGTTARFTANQSVTWTVNPSADFAVDSSGYLTINRNISGSSTVGGDQLSGSVTASNSFGTTSDTTFTVNITDNSAPTITFTNTSANLNTNGARPSNNLVTISFSDTEGDGVDLDSFTFTDPSGNLSTTQSGNTYLVRATTNLTAGVYPITASIQDDEGFATRTSAHSFTIAQAPIGTLSTNGTFRIIESAQSGSNIVTNANGIPTGTQADLGVSYSPTYNSAAVQSFTSSNAAIVVDSSGGLTLNTNISGSTTSSGDTILSDITYRDQYDNIGSGSITINVTANSAPTVTITDNNLDTDAALSGVTIATVSITDSESDTPYSLTLSGAQSASFTAVPQNAASSSWNLNATSNLSAGNYAITASATDTFSEVGSASETIVVTAAADYGKFYIYTSTRTGGGTLSAANYNGLMGISTVSSDTPPQVTAYTADTTSPLYKLKTGALGDASITVNGGALTRRAIASGSSPSQSLLDVGSFSGNGSTAEQIIFVYPSGSDLTGVPLSMTDAFGGSDAGDYVLNINDAGTFSNSINASIVHSIVLDSAHEGYTEWFVLGRTGTNTASTFEARLTAESGSAPS